MKGSKKFSPALFLCVGLICAGCGAHVPDADLTDTERPDAGQAIAAEPGTDMANEGQTNAGNTAEEGDETAPNSAEQALSVTLHASDMSAVRGSVVEIPVALTHNDGFAGIGLQITYDKKALTFEEIRLDDVFSQYKGLSDYTEVPDSNLIRASYLFVQNVDEVGTFAVLRFRVQEDAGDEAFVNVSVRDLTRMDDLTVIGNEQGIRIDIGE